MRRDDGLLLVRSEPVPPQYARQDAAVAGDILKPTLEAGQATSADRGETRLVAWRRVPDADIAVMSSVGIGSVTRAWAVMMLPYLCLGLFAMASLSSITLLALRHTRLAQAAEHLAEAERQRRRVAEAAALQGQKMEALGKLTGGVAHDFNNLLAVILGNAELAHMLPPEKLPRLLDNIIRAGQRGAALTRQLLSFSRGQAVEPKVLDPHAELPRMMEMLKPSLRGNIAMQVRVAEDVWLVEADPGELEIALLNIAVNARDVMPEGGSFIVEADNQRIVRGTIPHGPDLAGDFVRIAIRDTGPGIPTDVAARAFEPFYTTKDVGHGTGLGLSQVYGFARQAGGSVTIEAWPGGAVTPTASGAVATAASGSGGTTVTLYLPRTDKQIIAPTIVAPAEASHETGTRRVLLVEDNLDVAAITTDIIATLGYEVVHAERARAALDMLMQPGPPFHLLLTDVVMPDGMDGVELAATVRRRLPALPIILISGYNDVLREEHSDFRILRKPLPVEQLKQAIAAEADAYPRIVVDNTAGAVRSSAHRTS